MAPANLPSFSPLLSLLAFSFPVSPASQLAQSSPLPTPRKARTPAMHRISPNDIHRLSTFQLERTYILANVVAPPIPSLPWAAVAMSLQRVEVLWSPNNVEEFATYCTELRIYSLQVYGLLCCEYRSLSSSRPGWSSGQCWRHR